VLSPTIVATADDLGASVGAIAQARSVTAGVAIAASIAIAGRIDAMGVRRLLGLGAALAAIACGVLALSPTLLAFLLAHVLVGVAFACLLSAGFAGVAAFPSERRAGAIGYVVGGNALAWIVVSPLAGAVTGWLSWRVAEAIPAMIAMAALMMARAAALAPGAPAGGNLRDLLVEGSARRWIGAELIAYGAWTALLTFVGAFFIERTGMGEAAAGWLLAGGAAAHFFASSRSGTLATLVPRRALVAGSSLLLAALLPMELSARAPVLAVAAFWLMCLAAGARTPASSGLGLAQAPDRPGAMMAARSGTIQLGYLLGAAIGGVAIAGPGYGALGILLAVGMAASAVLVLRVDDPLEASPAATCAAP
jgi:predicted MFS family arabinose efflux permease